MKFRTLFLLGMLVSCTRPATPVPTQAPTPTTEVFDLTATVPPNTIPDVTLGTIQGNVSWLNAANSTRVPIGTVNLEINGHSGKFPRYTAETDSNGHYEIINIEPMGYGLGIYFNLPISERMCETPEYLISKDLGWLHYATATRVGVWYDILFSDVDLLVDPGETITVDFVLKCT